MNYPAAPNGGIAASLGQATGYPAENYHRPKGRGIKPSSAGGLKPLTIRWRLYLNFGKTAFVGRKIQILDFSTNVNYFYRIFLGLDAWKTLPLTSDLSRFKRTNRELKRATAHDRYCQPPGRCQRKNCFRHRWV